ncbi:MarR family winged helix-turn-helix transcriptional regulator [Neptunomonas qingdaonensis]|nr:MarR family winged helix-turn-helix transcriptional regulator [Neptunomonas qingdaonensis]
MKKLINQQLLERLASLLRSESRGMLLEHGLQPVQFEALQYIANCNRYSDTPMAVTEFLRQTKGTVSQTLKVLEKKGLIEKLTDAKDKRVTHLKITEDGRALTQQMLPSPILETASDLMSNDEVAMINSSLHTLLYQLQNANNFKPFGQCASCVHNIKQASGEYFCGLTQEVLTPIDIELICREHQYSQVIKP